MSDNTQLNTGVGGDIIRNVLKGAAKTQVVMLDLGGAGAEALTNGVLPVQNATGATSWGQSLAVVAGATASLVNIVSTTAGYQIKGLLAHGTADGYFAILVAGITLVSGRTRSTAPMLQLILSNGIAVAAGSNVSVRVTNESGSTADYEVTLLGA
jgi:hypothetical protein